MNLARKPGFFVNGHEFAAPDGTMTGKGIKALAGIPSNFELYEIQTDKAVLVEDEQLWYVRSNQWFRAVPVGTAKQHGLYWN